MKIKKLLIVIILLLVPLLLTNKINATDNIIENINIDVHIDENGDAHFTEVWNAEVYSGTQAYKNFNKMQDANIKDLVVKDEKGNIYQGIDAWDKSASKEDKDDKSSVVKNSDNYTIYFGIGEYGKHTYTLEYTITKFIYQFDGDQGIRFSFIDMDLEVSRMNINISSDIPFTKNNSDLYSFGFVGTINYTNDDIVLKSTGKIDHVSALIRISDKTYPNTNNYHKSFSEALKDADNSNYYTSKAKSSNSYFVYLIFIAVIAVMYFVKKSNDKAAKKKFAKIRVAFEDGRKMPKIEDVPIRRSIPFEKDIFKFYYFAKRAEMTKDNSGIIVALVSKWIISKQVQLIKQKDTYIMNFNQNITCSEMLEEELFKMFKLAANNDGILGASDFKIWCNKNHQKIDGWFKKIDKQEEDKLIKNNLLKKSKDEKHKIYSHALKNEFNQVIGFKKFLLNSFTEVDISTGDIIWDEYLISASVLGLANKVQEELKQYVGNNQILSKEFYESLWVTGIYISTGVNSAISISNPSQGGFGGFGSFGGGGGFSGGGGGGFS